MTNATFSLLAFRDWYMKDWIGRADNSLILGNTQWQLLYHKLVPGRIRSRWLVFCRAVWLLPAWIGWWMMCWTAGWAVAAFGNCEAGLRTVVTLELDITAAAAAPGKHTKCVKIPHTQMAPLQLQRQALMLAATYSSLNIVHFKLTLVYI